MSSGSADADSRSKRYDRQIRIWGAEGQARLEGARVALLGAGPTGAETLKNLVLGGIASFTVVDGARVAARDMGNNFLVAPDSLGEPRAKVCAHARAQTHLAAKPPRQPQQCRQQATAWASQACMGGGGATRAHAAPQPLPPPNLPHPPGGH
jgi:hypothetical protein